MFFVYIWCAFDNLEALFLKIDYMYFYVYETTLLGSEI